MTSVDTLSDNCVDSEPNNGSVSYRKSIVRSSISQKIQSFHLDRQAIVYIRQSTPQQVLEHRESRDRQYALAEFAAAFRIEGNNL